MLTRPGAMRLRFAGVGPAIGVIDPKLRIGKRQCRRSLAEGEEPTPLRLLFAHVEGDGMIWLRYEVIRADEQPPDAG